ncbi:NADH-quinone oxidoreductase subunit N [Blastopirellula sp. JC732]|uniref:NADH-quinone oxidoreductase subunit N n=1 Tax=Blastopirellula sediminis TaxID=2894196 RepID=A0A9X1SG65_9BACT|nr:NADH-quinone oxidoreductase subunit N [Blastopirellula sediminis]MCC9607654.1 NADH-quinone oxidoreductase subunit N [Blastopirellula sediminis]MCC9629053.1 NADH-quinone oxidoreductase subunit N [Blastopirellula sediminis]
MFYQLIEQLRIDTLQQSLPLIGAELTLTIAIVLILFCRMLPGLEKIDSVWLGIGGVIAALVALRPFQPWSIGAEGPTPISMGALQPTELFTGMLTHDGFAIAIKALLLFFLLLFFLLTKITRLSPRYDSADFVVLVLGSTLGMFMMVASNHMIMIFMGVEMASVPSYAMVALQRRNKKASEAALKYAVYGAGAAGVMLYGISLLCGVLNSAHLPTMATRLSELLATETHGSEVLVLALGGLMLGVGLSFKLSAFPFHFWCPDVFEGATSEVNAFLSVASKAAALALLVRVAIGFTTLPAQPEAVAKQTVPAVEQLAADEANVQLVNFVDAKVAADEAKPVDPLSPARKFVCLLIAVIAVVTCTFGNLAAYAQTNIKRLLAYSTIAHAGYMMMAVPAAIAVAEVDKDAARQAIAYLTLYVVIYLFMNLGAFAAVAFVRQAVGSDEIKDYAGMLRRGPTVAVCLTLILVSLIGLPPLAGFIGKFAVFAAIAQAWNATSYPFLMLLLIAGGLNTAISLFYYLRIAKVMTIDGESDDTAPMQQPIGIIQNGYLALVTAPLVLLMFNWDFLNAWLLEAVSQILT